MGSFFERASFPAMGWPSSFARAQYSLGVIGEWTSAPVYCPCPCIRFLALDRYHYSLDTLEATRGLYLACARPVGQGAQGRLDLCASPPRRPADAHCWRPDHLRLGGIRGDRRSGGAGPKANTKINASATPGEGHAVIRSGTGRISPAPRASGGGHGRERNAPSGRRES